MRARQPTLAFFVASALAGLAGCSQTPAPSDTGASDVDAAPSVDAAIPPDAVALVDAARVDAAPPSDAGPMEDGGLPFGCNASSGVDCDGDYTDRCTPACTADQCCSPQHGTFTCMPRNADGTCPLADLFIDGRHIDGSMGSYVVEYVNFEPGDCAIAEGCVDAPGVRRLLRWDTWTPNQGTADMFLGRTPRDGVSSGPYVWSQCHMHHHFQSYADYELLASDGSQAAHGHKQAFCLLDYHQYPCGGAGQPACRYPDPMQHYTCGNQGIERDWQDVYERDLDCQWIDVTDVDPGDYQLHISLNTLHILPESSYDNNELLVGVTIPALPEGDVTQACAMRTDGLARDCGWTRATDPSLGTCTPGASVTVGCSAACGLGACTNDTILRVCDGTHAASCTAPYAIAMNDDSGCGGGACTGGDCCSQVTFTCPASGTYAAFWAPFSSRNAATCTLAAR